MCEGRRKRKIVLFYKKEPKNFYRFGRAAGIAFSGKIAALRHEVAL
jgi:hypothetical protein